MHENTLLILATVALAMLAGFLAGYAWRGSAWRKRRKARRLRRGEYFAYGRRRG